MNLKEHITMLPETPISDNAGALKEDSSLDDPDLVSGELSVSPVQSWCSNRKTHESTVSMVTPDKSGADALVSAFNSISAVECPEQRDGVAKSESFAPNNEALRAVQTLDQIKDTTLLSSDFANFAEPSTQGDGEREVLDEIHEVCKDNHAMIVYTSTRRSTRGNKSNQKKQAVKPPRSNKNIASKTPLVDFDSLQISRRRRSLVIKRVRSSVWGPLGNIVPDSDHGVDLNKGNRNNTRRKSGTLGKKKTGKNSIEKSCTPTGPISLKIKFGNQSCVIPSVNENLDASAENKSVSSDVGRKLVQEMPEDVLLPCGNLGKVTPSDASVHDTHLEVSVLVDNSSSNTSKDHNPVNTENRFSDPGTSPDSEVINSVPDAEVFEKGLPDMQDSSVTLSMPVSFGNVAGISSTIMKSKQGQKKENQLPLGDCSMESKLTGKETTGSAKELITHEPGPIASGEKPFHLIPSQCPRTSKDPEMISSSDLVAVSDSSHSVAGGTLIHCNSTRKFPKSSKAKAGSRSGTKSLGLGNKQNEASGNRKNKSHSSGKIQVTEKDAELVIHNGVDGQLISGNQSSIPGEEAKLSKVFGEFADGSTNMYAASKNAWVLCDECKKWRRISATLADQIEVTNCGWTCRENSDENFADCSVAQEKSNTEINRELEISDEEDARETIQKSKKKQSKVDQPPSYSQIKLNLFLHRSRKTQTIDEVMVCHCKPPSDGRMGCGAKCLNRILNIECVRGTCPCGELCSNQQFQKRKYAKLKWFKCGKKGFGLKALEDISAGRFIIEYVGEVLDMHNYEARQRDYALKGHRHFYFMTLNGSEVIDACSKGNLGRFINHSCDPNCRTEKWMVNGEVCVGLFAIKDIKKGEEVTFDYNYVRVFGAAVKKCVCGSSNCRGYIGGDPTSSEVIVQDDSDDEFSEPLMVCEDNDIRNDLSNIISNSSPDKENNSDEPSESIYFKENLVTAQVVDSVAQQEFEAVRCVSDRSPSEVQQLNINEDSDKSLLGSSDDDIKVGSLGPSHTRSSMKFGDKSKSRMNKTVSSSQIEYPSIQKATGTASSPHKSQLDITESKRKVKSDTVGRDIDLQKSNSLHKPHRSASSIKKGKLKAKNTVVSNGNTELDKTNAAHKSRKFPNITLNSHVEAVEDKLNHLLDSEGGINRRKDASKGYLKLLFLTAASGNSGDGESIQSNRDLSMILDALLKTKSCSVLLDIVNKNGLQMLHNIMKRYRKEFHRTPILRKLLKILEYLAKKEILTSEHITGGPPRPGVESFKDSILSLTEHVDKQVHQIARNFRDTWIRRFMRRNSRMEADDWRMEYHHHAAYNRSSSSYDEHSDRGLKSSEPLGNCQKQPKLSSTTVDTSTIDQPSASVPSSVTNTTRTRKRKSRWDTPADESMYHKVTSNNTQVNEKADIDEDVPPGFSTPCNNSKTPPIVSSFSSNNNQERNSGIKHTSGFILGESQQRFTARVPVSYGVPSSIMEQFGVFHGETPKGLTMSPGLPFYPFPPLPPHPKNSVGSAENCGGTSSVGHHSGQKRPFTCSNANEPETNGFMENDERGGGSYSLGRKYFKQQKWNNNSKLPPWVRLRNGWGNARNGVQNVGLGSNEHRDSYDSNGVNWRGGEF